MYHLVNWFRESAPKPTFSQCSLAILILLKTPSTFFCLAIPIHIRECPVTWKSVTTSSRPSGTFTRRPERISSLFSLPVVLEVVPAASDCECADGTRVLAVTQEARALNAQDVHEAALRGVEEESEERLEGDEEGLRDLTLVSCIARKDEDSARQCH